MKRLLKKIDSFLLPQSPPPGDMRYAPYIWLLYLFIFFISLAAYHPIEYSYLFAAIGTVLFLIVYFNGFWASNKQLKWNVLAILIIGSLLAQLTVGASVFYVYAAAFCCRLGTAKKAFIWLVFIAIWVGVYSWFFELNSFFYIPAIVFSFMIGGINIYQHDIDIKRKELILSQQEVKHLAKISERERIARDLHDLIGHTFSVITLKAELAGKLIEKDQLKAKNEIRELETISRDALKQVREVVTGYRTSDLNTELAHAKYVLESNDIHFNYQFDAIDIKNSTNKELAIILKELVTNILKHSKASQANCHITESNKQIVFKLKDNGIGFGNDQQTLNSNGFGLKGIQERVEKLLGTLEFFSKQGSQFTILIPQGSKQ